MFYRRRLDEAGVGPTGVRTKADLAKVPTTSLAEGDDPPALVLRPAPQRVAAGGPGPLALPMLWPVSPGQQARAARRRIAPVYKPIHWTITPTTNGSASGLIVGSSAADLDRLSEL